jgi:hypothetical protein
MKRPKLEDTKTPSGHQSIGGRSVNVYEYSKKQDEYIDYLESKAENLPISPVSARTEMRKQAITVFELTKGFTGEPTNNAMKTALEMAGYVMRLTNDLD